MTSRQRIARNGLVQWSLAIVSGRHVTSVRPCARLTECGPQLGFTPVRAWSSAVHHAKVCTTAGWRHGVGERAQTLACWDLRWVIRRISVWGCRTVGCLSFYSTCLMGIVDLLIASSTGVQQTVPPVNELFISSTIIRAGRCHVLTGGRVSGSYLLFPLAELRLSS